MFNIYPDNMSTNVILPLGHDRTLTIFEWYFASPAPAAAGSRCSRRSRSRDEIQQEDIVLCEQVQRGLRSRAYDRGRFSAKRENGVHHFQSLVREFLEARARASYARGRAGRGRQTVVGRSRQDLADAPADDEQPEAGQPQPRTSSGGQQLRARRPRTAATSWTACPTTISAGQQHEAHPPVQARAAARATRTAGSAAPAGRPRR